jgi:two-component system sensor histidine kinase/response regulator
MMGASMTSRVEQPDLSPHLRPCIQYEYSMATNGYSRPVSHEEAGALLKDAHVLLVEDNDINQALALDMLHAFGMNADAVGNGAQAVAQVGLQNYDAVLMDCQMPVMDGYEAAMRIRQDPRNADLPILAMTANAMQEEKEKCRAAGMNAHIAKPINMDELFITLAHWIRPAVHTFAASTSDDHLHQLADNRLPQLPGVDTARALKRIGGDAARYRKLLAVFSEGQADTCDRINDAVHSGDHETALLLTHTLKGLAATIGDDTLTAASGALEHALKHHTDAEIEHLVTDVTVPLQRLIQAIAHNQPPATAVAQQEQRAQHTETALDLHACARRLRRLAELLKHGSSLATGEVEPIVAMLEGHDIAPRFQAIANLIGRYDFDPALMLLRDFARELDVDLEVS